MKLRLRWLTIDFDRDYGCYKRTGWSIAWDGHYLVELEKHFFVAVYKAIMAI